jgi:putative FmdB family regulatory protein
MPIIRTYQCEDCNHRLDLTIPADDWDAPSPTCPECAARPMSQEFRPFAIGGTPAAKAQAIAEDIAARDYHVADMQRDKHALTPTVRYQDASREIPQSSWQAAGETLQQAIASGRETRLKHGSGLDILQANLKSGAEPDLIANSKKRAMRVW